MTDHSPDAGNMVRPVRLRLSRQKGFNLQAHSIAVNGLPAVSVARPGKWGNPFTAQAAREAGFLNPATMAVYGFSDWLEGNPWACGTDHMEARRQQIITCLPELRGKNLACWCLLDAPCHAYVLLALANRQDQQP